MGLLILVRHGQASAEQADYDVLSPLGWRQARLVATRLARGRVDRVASGALSRQRDTAAAVLRATGATGATGALTVDARLDEYDHTGMLAVVHTGPDRPGARERGVPAVGAAGQDTLDAALARWMAGDDLAGESHDAFVERVLAVVDDLGRQPGVTVAATSGGVIAVTVAHHLGLPAGEWPRLARVTVNSGVSKLLTGRSGTTVLTFNDFAHLEEDRALVTYR